MFLQEAKEIYKSNADLISDWESLDISELCNRYILLPEDSSLKDSYLSAIICKDWNLIISAYNAQGIKSANPEDCYNWLIDSVLYVLEKRAWTNPEHKMYQDKKAPEKAINVTLKSLKCNFYYLAKMQKRTLNYTSLSLDRLREEFSDSIPSLPNTNDQYHCDDNTVESIVKRFFLAKEYFYAFATDAIAYTETYSRLDTNSFKFNSKLLRKHLKSIDSDYCDLFATRYQLPVADVEQASAYVTNLSQSAVDERLWLLFKLLKHEHVDKELQEDINVTRSV